MNFSLETSQESVSQMEIVVAFKTDQPAAGIHQPFECIQHLIVLAEGVRGEADPEIKQVTHDVKGVRLTFQFMQETDKHLEIAVSRVPQMGIGQEYCSHTGIVLTKRNVVNN
jgi:hypothetical protein